MKPAALTLAGIALGLFWFWLPVVWLVIPVGMAAWWMSREIRGSRFHSLLAAMLIIAALVRVAAVLGNGILADRFAGPNEPWDLIPDGSVYASYGEYIAELVTGHTGPPTYKVLVHRVENTGLWPAWNGYQVTGMSYWNGLWFSLFSTTPAATRLINCLASLMAAVLLFRFMRRRFDERAAALVLGGLLFYPTLAVWAASGAKEWLVVLLSIVFLLALDPFAAWPIGRRHIGLAALMAASAAATYFLRAYVALLLVGTAGLVLLWRIAVHAWSTRRPAIRALLIVSAIGAAAAGWHRAVAGTEQFYQHSLRSSVAHYAVDPAGATGYRLYPKRFYEQDYARLPSVGPNSDLIRLSPKQKIVTALLGMARFFFSPYPSDLARSRALYAVYPLALLNLALLPFVVAGALWGLRTPASGLLPLTVFMILISFVIGLHSGNVGTVVRVKDMAMPFYFVLAAVGIGRIFNWRTHAVSVV